ncbi:N-acetylmuramoyl-L-alanine amidase [bacterium]|nr:N-acetylmuramoyl-L-alanine amidase [bacterium]
MTKTEHDNPTFQQRAQVALDNDCDFMISIHTNAGSDSGHDAIGIYYAKSIFRVDYYHGTPPPTPVENDFTPAEWDEDFQICKQFIQNSAQEAMPYVVGNEDPDRSIWLNIKAVEATKRIPFDPKMVRYKIDHQGTELSETQWMPAGNNTDDFLITHRQNTSNIYSAAARYIVNDESSPTAV